MSLEYRLLQALSAWRGAPRWSVALSGGLDSLVLLHALSRLREQHALPPLRALHVAHGLQTVAEDWPAHCQTCCEAWQVPLEVLAVQVPREASLEQAARQARYAALGAQLQDGELLLLAQHADDQVETVLQRLLRGTGVRGLAGMPSARPLAAGWLFRPLLNESRATLAAYAEQHALRWVDDPSNLDLRFTRNRLRHQVLPALREHWPGVDASLRRCAEQAAEAQGLLDELAVTDLAAAQQPAAWDWLGLPQLALAPLCALSQARQRNALRHWLAPRTLLPDAAHWAGWEALRDAGEDRQPVWRLHAGELRRSAGRLFWLSGDWCVTPEEPPAWTRQTSLALPGNGVLHVQGVLPAGQVSVHYRRGGELLCLPGRGQRDLKRLFNERDVPAFLRQRWPLLAIDGQLRAVAGLAGLDGRQCGDWQVQWQPPPSS